MVPYLIRLAGVTADVCPAPRPMRHRSSKAARIDRWAAWWEGAEAKRIVKRAARRNMRRAAKRDPENAPVKLMTAGYLS